MGTIYFELAQGSSMRLCLKMEEMFPDLRGRQLELMIQLCLVAYNSEIYDGVGSDAWLRTIVSFPKCCSPDFSVFSEDSVERGVLERIAALSNAWPTRWRDLQRLHRELAARVQIHSNIVPRDAYREKLLQELHQHGSVTGQPFRRDFYPIRVLANAMEMEISASQMTEEWRMNGGRCVLADQPSMGVRHAFPRDRLREVKRTQVNTMETLGNGVCKVSWRNGIYARKSFDFLHKFEKERNVALRVSHPHIVHPIAQISDMPGHPRLLMEALGSDLYRFAIEQDFARSVNSLFLGHMDSLDVLLQIARGMKSLHDSNVVHGDLKPHNILFSRFELSENTPHFLVKIADFDQAQFIVPGEAFKPLHGTTIYAAPEVLNWTRLNVQDVPLSDPKKLDIYSFGSIAYEVLTGQGVYDGLQFDVKKVVEGKLLPHGSIKDDDTSAMTARFNKSQICHPWQKIKMTYPYELVQNVESCWELDPGRRPTSSELCEVLQRSMSEMQRREQATADMPWNYFVPYFITTICALASRYVNLVKSQNKLVDFVFKIAVVMLIVFGCASTTLIVSPLF